MHTIYTTYMLCMHKHIHMHTGVNVNMCVYIYHTYYIDVWICGCVELFSCPSDCQCICHVIVLKFCPPWC